MCSIDDSQLCYHHHPHDFIPIAIDTPPLSPHPLYASWIKGSMCTSVPKAFIFYVGGLYSHVGQLVYASLLVLGH